MLQVENFPPRKQQLEQYSRLFQDQHETSHFSSTNYSERHFLYLFCTYTNATQYTITQADSGSIAAFPLGRIQYPASHIFKPSSGKNKRIFLYISPACPHLIFSHTNVRLS
ncbi:hypothetical protein BCV60_16210 [Bacillus halotolerans]|nr:hypothetical protein BCV60_16210 [Bacillus halotolerans]